MAVARAGRRDPRAKLTHDQIVETARELLEDGGMEALNMRRLASSLGVAPMTLYTYFPDKDTLVDAVIDRGVSELSIPVTSGPWRPQLRALLTLAYEQLVANPYVVQVRQRRPVASPGALRFTEAGLRLLHRAGFGLDEAARAFRPLFIYTFGYAAFASQPNPEEARRQARGASLSVSPEDYPAVSAAAQGMADAMTGRDQFLYGLDRILDGLEAELRRRSRRGRR